MSSCEVMSGRVESFSKENAIANKLAGDLDSKLVTSSKQVLLQRIEFKPASKPDEQYEKLKQKYKPLNSGTGYSKIESNLVAHGGKFEDIPAPKHVLCAPEKVTTQWNRVRRMGPGLSNLGNTCFLNSVVQVLTYTAPLVNYLSTQEHTRECRVVGFCMMCELQRHILRTFNHQQNESIKPLSIIQRLRSIAKHLRFGHQEDAHEFLRYVIDGMQKSCLAGLPEKLDRYSKESTVVHCIFGGYYRSQVQCLKCHNTSNTFDPLMELILEIKHSPSVIRAIQRFCKPELLDGDNLYQCPRCKKKVPAKKQVLIHRLPNILTVQLKRFDYNHLFGGKVGKDVQYTEYLDLRPFMTNPKGPPIKYKLFAVLVHSGHSCNSGHYYCYVRGSNDCWYNMNDSIVRQVGLNTVLSQQAYLLFYSIVGTQTQPQVKKHFSPITTKSPSSIASPTFPKVIRENDVGTPVSRSGPQPKPSTSQTSTTTKSTHPTLNGHSTPTPLTPATQRPKLRFTLKSKSQGNGNASMNGNETAGVEDSMKKSEEKIPKLGSPLKEVVSKQETVGVEESMKKSKEKTASLKEVVSKQETVGKRETEELAVKEKLSAKEIDKAGKKEEKHATELKDVKTSSSAAKESKTKTDEELSKTEQEKYVKKDEKHPSSLIDPKSSSSAAKESNVMSPPRVKPVDVSVPMQDKKVETPTKKSRPPPLFIPRSVQSKVPSKSASVAEAKIAQIEERMINKEMLTSPMKATTPWKVTPKGVSEPLFGPMSPPPYGTLAPQQSPMSDVSCASSIVGKTGEWAVMDKMTPTPGPRLPERQHAGWSVSKKNGSDSESKTEDTTEKDEDWVEAESDEKKRKKEKKKRKKEKRRKYEKLGSGSDQECENESEGKRSETDENENSNKENKKRKKKRKEKERHRKSDEERRLLEEESDESQGELQVSQEESKKSNEEQKDSKGKPKESKEQPKKFRGEPKESQGEPKERAKRKKDSGSGVESKRRRLVDYYSSEDDSNSSCNHDNAADRRDLSSSYQSSRQDERKKSRAPPVVVYDGDRPQTTKQRRSTWDGSRDSSVVSQLLRDGGGISGYGNSVTSWEGERSVVDSYADDDGKRKKRHDSWNEELDQGKVKKVKDKSKYEQNTPRWGNPFQREQERKSRKGGVTDRVTSHFSRRHSSHSRSHSSRGYRRF